MGAKDAAGRGKVIQRIKKWLSRHLPRGFILENVKGLTTRHRKCFVKILKSLAQIQGLDGEPYYKIQWKVLNSKNYNVPQARNIL